MSGAEIVQVLRGRSFRDTLFGKVRYGQAVMRSADGVQCEVPVVIKEYDRELVERRMTKNGEHVGEDAKEELRIHSLLSQASPTTAPSTTSSSSSSSPAPSSGHPHVVHLYDVRKDERYYYAILQFCARGEFFPLVQHADFSPLYARHYFRQLMLGLQFMHRQHIAHRDLSLENILLDDKGDLKMYTAHTPTPPHTPPHPSSLTALHRPVLTLRWCCHLRASAAVATSAWPCSARM